jgi:tetratricopeptide (TPR) repeat protein
MKPASQLKFSALALAVSLALGSAVATVPVGVAADAPAAKPTVSKALAKPISEAQKAIAAKKFDDALAKLTEAEAMPTRTPYDTFAIAQLRAYSLGQLGRMNDAIPSYVVELESGFMSPEETDRLSRGVAALYYQQKDYPHAIEFGQKSIARGSADSDTWFVVAYSQFLSGNTPESLNVVNQYLADAAKKGQVPAENVLQLLLQVNIKAKDNAGVTAALAKLTEFYKKPEYWHDLLGTMRDNAGRGASSEGYTLNVYRLMREVGTMKEGSDFLEMAQLAVSQGSPGEAVDAITRGQKLNAFSSTSDASASKLQLQSAQKLADADRAGLSKFEAEAKAAKTGEGDVRLGQALLSYDQPDKAVEAIQRGIGKGGLRNADEAQILLGISLLRLGRKDEAVAAFGAAKGSDARLVGLAKLWGVFARG